MPLYNRKPFAAAEKPDDLKPDEVVYKIDFTNEIFRSYDEYLERMNLYGERAWTCKLTGKGKLTYQEALASEQTASQKIRNIPQEYLSPVLREIQFSMLPMKDLLESICSKFQGPFSAGNEVYVKMDGALHPCKIVEEIKESSDKTEYKVEQLGINGGPELVIGDEQLVKNLPISRQVLMSFIKGSTSQSRPWTLHKDLATRHGISGSDYPMDDLLVQPSEEDRMLPERPNLCRDFGFPMESVGDFLLVWNFCDSFSKVLRLSPFSFEDFKKSVSYTERAPPIVVQACVALLQLLAENNKHLFEDAEITETNWSQYLFRLFEGSAPELSNHAASIEQGRYSLLTVPEKISILRELVHRALVTDAFRPDAKCGNRKRQHIIADGGIEQGGERREGDKAAKRLKVGDSNSPSDSERVLSPKELLAKKSPEQKMEKCFLRSTPLGRDRTYNRYWFFEREGRIFVENHESTQWGYYQSKNEVDALIGSLNPKGVRERALKQQLQQSYDKICDQFRVRWKEAVAAADPSVQVRRSARNRSEDTLPSFLKYVNKYVKK